MLYSSQNTKSLIRYNDIYPAAEDFLHEGWGKVRTQDMLRLFGCSYSQLRIAKPALIRGAYIEFEGNGYDEIAYYKPHKDIDSYSLYINAIGSFSAVIQRAMEVNDNVDFYITSDNISKPFIAKMWRQDNPKNLRSYFFTDLTKLKLPFYLFSEIIRGLDNEIYTKDDVFLLFLADLTDDNFHETELEIPYINTGFKVIYVVREYDENNIPEYSLYSNESPDKPEGATANE